MLTSADVVHITALTSTPLAKMSKTLGSVPYVYSTHLMRITTDQLQGQNMHTSAIVSTHLQIKITMGFWQKAVGIFPYVQKW